MRRYRSTLYLILAAACFVGAGGLNTRLVQRRAAMMSVEPLENAPPVMVFTTVVLGGLRGVIADMLWLRLSALQQEGRHIELVQLSDWITKLEPRRGKVWSYHGWNMAYNVSVMMPTAEDRWRWVKNGMQLLRDEGLTYNPHDYRVHQELAWIYMDKLGGTGDQAAPYYRGQWAAEMRALFGGSRPDYARLKTDPVRARQVREDYKLNVELMQELEARYGPLDWTSPFTHSLYWSYRGSRYATGFGARKLDQTFRISLRFLTEAQAGETGARE